VICQAKDQRGGPGLLAGIRGEPGFRRRQYLFADFPGKN